MLEYDNIYANSIFFIIFKISIVHLWPWLKYVCILIKKMDIIYKKN